MTVEIGELDSRGIQPCVEPMPNKGSVAYRRLVTQVKGGDVFVRRLKIIRYKYQKCQWVYITKNGKLVRKLVIYGTLKRKPRGMKWPA